MKYLIDTQILIWFQNNDSNLKKEVLDVLVNIDNEILVSQISLFEIAIKQKVGKLPELDVSIDIIVDLIKSDNFQILPIKNEHIAAYNKIPLFENHRDPFDRLLIATSFSEKIPLISGDKNFGLYKDLAEIFSN